MKRKILGLFLVLTVTAALSACGAKPLDLGMEWHEESLDTENIEDLQGEETVIIEEDEYRGYGDIIEDYISFYNEKTPYDETSVSDLIGEKSSVMNFGTYNNPWLGADEDGYFDESGSGYMYSNSVSLDAKYYDANGDGVDELFIVEFTDDDNYDNYGNIHDMWTMIEGRPKYVTYFDSRYDLKIGEDGSLLEYLSSGFNSSSCATIEFNSDGTFTTADIVEQIPDVEDPFRHNNKPISEREYNKLLDEYYNKKVKNLNTLEGVSIGRWEK